MLPVPEDWHVHLVPVSEGGDGQTEPDTVDFKPGLRTVREGSVRAREEMDRWNLRPWTLHPGYVL